MTPVNSPDAACGDTAAPGDTSVLERHLDTHRDRMTLRERVELRRRIDHTTGVAYLPLTHTQATRLAVVMPLTNGLAANEKTRSR